MMSFENIAPLIVVGFIIQIGILIIIAVYVCCVYKENETIKQLREKNEELKDRNSQLYQEKNYYLFKSEDLRKEIFLRDDNKQK